jgi:sterol desaturase/sphingolipid hydroxylase (fatty acid hydroxylase superfamily)
VDAGMGMLIHSNTSIRFGPLIYILNGSEMHRWHHCRDKNIRDCNFGNNFSVFDWLFGTAYVSHAAEAEFGVDDDAIYPHESILGQFLFAFRSRKQPLTTTSASNLRKAA